MKLPSSMRCRAAMLVVLLACGSTQAVTRSLTATFAGYSRAETLTNFPVLVALNESRTNFSYSQFLSPAGHDLRFYDSSRTNELPYEIDTWNTNGDSTVWVRVPRLSSSNDCIWASWGDPAKTNRPAYTTNGAVWSADYRLVLHMGSGADSSTNHLGGSVSNVSFSAGGIGDVGWFNGTNSRIAKSHSAALKPNATITISAWVRPDGLTTQRYRNIYRKEDLSARHILAFQEYGTIASFGLHIAGAYHELDVPISAANYTDGWHLVTGVYDGSAKRMYSDGVQIGLSNNVGALDTAGTAMAYIGCTEPEAEWYQGGIDELSLSGTARSSNWVWACYANQKTNSAFIRYELVYQLSTNVGPYGGGNPVTITNITLGHGSDITNVLVGGEVATITGQGGNWVAITVPPAESAGAKDIVIQSLSVGPTVLPSAYAYCPAGVIRRLDWSKWQEVRGIPAPRSDLAWGVLAGALYVGGSDNGGSQTNVYRFDGTAWTEAPGLPAPRARPASGVLDGSWYVVGGSDGTNFMDTTYRFDGVGWTSVAPLPAHRTDFAAAVLDGALYTVGGWDSACKTNVYRFDGASWTEVAGLPAIRGGLTASVLGDALYAVSGSDGFAARTNVFRYDGASWTPVAGIPSARMNNPGGVLNGQICLPAGYNGSPKTNLYLFDGTNWTEGVGLPAARSHHAADVFNGQVYVVGGINSSLAPQTNVYRYPYSSSGVSPSIGSVTGGYPVTIVGSDLGDGGDILNVTLCGVSVAGIVSQSATQVVVTAAAGSPGLGDVEVNSVSRGATVASNAFAYVVGYEISTNNGPYAGGNTLTVTNITSGTGWDVTNVLVGGDAATITGQGENWVSFTVPAGGAAGAKDIVIQSASAGTTTLSSAYTVNPAGVIPDAYSAQPLPATITLTNSWLDGTNGVLLAGPQALSYGSIEVSSAGDVNHDGFADFLVASFRAPAAGASGAGETYLVYGQATGLPPSIMLTNTWLNGTNGVTLRGVIYAGSGFSVSSAGDVNGDGFDEILIGAIYAGSGGQTYLVYGRSNGLPSIITLSGTWLNGTNGVILAGGSASSESGVSVSSAGDVNGDGLDDILVGAHYGDPSGRTSAGETYLVYGRTNLLPATVTLSGAWLDGTNGVILGGAVTNDYSGYAVSGAGDVNGDGFDDLLVGAWFAAPSGITRAGEAYLVYGRATGLPAQVTLSSAWLDGTNGIIMAGAKGYDGSGCSLSSAGDVNGDGFDDFLVGAYNAAPLGIAEAGATYLIYGRATGLPALITLTNTWFDGSNGVILAGTRMSGYSGGAISSAGDVNNDGFADIVVGAYYASPPGRSHAGESYLVYGRATGFPATISLGTNWLDGTNGVYLPGANASDYSGYSVSGAGDVNGDGFADFLVGAEQADPAGVTNAGETYLVYGRSTRGFAPVSPSSGSITGGYQVVIIGSNLSNGSDVTNVTICGASVAGIVSQSATQIVVTVGVGVPGLGDVRVCSVSFGETVKSNAFTYYNGDQTITFPPIAAQWITNKVGLAATASSGLPVSFAVGSGPASIAGGTNLTFSGTGTVSIVASQGGDATWNPAPNVTNAFAVTKAMQAPLSFTPASPQTYNTTNTLSATGGSGTGAVSYAAPSGPGQIVGGNGLKMLSGTGMVTVVATKAADDLYHSIAATATVAAAKAAQSITFPAIGDQVTTGKVGLAATASSGLGVSFSVGSGSATISGGTNLSFTGAGTVKVVASQAGNTNWGAAPNVTNTLNVTKVDQAPLSLTPASPQTYNTTNTLSATGGSGTGAVSYAVQSGAGQIVGSNKLKMLAGTGSVTVVATKAADGTYNAAAATGVVVAAKATQAALLVVASSPQGYKTTNTLSTMGGSGTGAVSYAVLSGPGQIVGVNGLTMTAGTGTVSVAATKAADNRYLQRSATGSVAAAKAAQTITFPAIGDQWVTNKVGLAATASSGLDVTFVGSGPASITGGTNLSFTGAGVVRIVASQAGDAGHAAAPSVTNALMSSSIELGGIQASQVDDGRGRVRVNYTWLTHGTSEVASIGMSFSTNAGRSWTAMSGGTVTGDYGGAVTVGVRSAIWDAPQQLSSNTFNNNCGVRLTATANGETVTNFSSLFRIDLKGLNGGLMVVGYVGDTNGWPVHDATVTLGVQTTKTVVGLFALNNVAIIKGNILSASYPGFVSQSRAISVPAGAIKVVARDFRLGTNLITSLEPGWGLYLSDGAASIVEMYCTYSSGVNWGDLTPSTLTFKANNNIVTNITEHTPDADGRATYACTIDMSGTDFSPSFWPWANRVGVRAEGLDEGTGFPVWQDVSRDVVVLPIPPLFVDWMTNRTPVPGSKMLLLDNLPFPQWPIEWRLPVPKPVGPFAFTVGASLRIGYDVQSGYYEVGLGAGTKSDQRDTLPTEFQNPLFANSIRNPMRGVAKLQPTKQTELVIGNNVINVYVQAVAMGVASPARGISLDAFKVALGLNTRLLLGYVSLLGGLLPPGCANVPGNPLQYTAVAIYATAAFDANMIFDLKPTIQGREVSGTMKVGLQAAYEPTLGPVKLRIYVGGEGSAGVRFPPLGWTNCLVRAYAGGEFKIGWLFWIPVGPFTLWQYPPAQQGLLALVGDDDPLADFRRPQLIRRDYLDQGGEVFVASESTSTRRRDTQDLTSLSAFRAIGQAPVQGSVRIDDGGTPARLADHQVNLQIVTNAFPDSSPALAGISSNLMLLYVADNGSSNSLQFSDIRWTWFDGWDWSTPTAVVADTRAEFNPQVRFDGNGDAVAVWERVTDPDFTNADPNALAAEMEIAWSRWDHATKQWAEPGSLTANAYEDRSPLLAGPLADGDLLAVWVENTSNFVPGVDAVGSTQSDTIVWSRWSASGREWSAPGVLMTNLLEVNSMSFSAGSNLAVFAWTTSTDEELHAAVWSNGTWSESFQCTSNAVPDRNVRVVVSSAGDVLMVWQEESNLVSSLDFSPTARLVRAASDGLGFTDYAMTHGPDGNVVLLWQEMATNGPDAHVAVYDPASDTWSKDICLFNDTSLERSFAPVWDDVGNLTVAYNAVDVFVTNILIEADGVVVSNVPQPGAVSVSVVKRALVKDVAIGAGDFTVDGGNHLPGDALTLSARLRNVGDIAVTNAVVGFYNGDPAAGGALITNVAWDGWLEGASTDAVLSADWVVPEPATNLELYAVANPGRAFTEFTEDNNTQTVSVGGTDLFALFLSADAGTSGAMRVFARVENQGAPGATNTVLALRRQGEAGAPLATADVPALDPGHSAEVVFDLPDGTQPEGDAFYVLNTDESNVVWDAETNNNRATFTVNLWLDTDKDGMPNGWEDDHELNRDDPADAGGDEDADGITNYEEWRAGTDPNDDTSYLSVVNLAAPTEEPGTAGFVLTWGSESNRFYTVSRAFALVDGIGFGPIAQHIEATPPANTYVDSYVAPTNQPVFYRVDVE